MEYKNHNNDNHGLGDTESVGKARRHVDDRTLSDKIWDTLTTQKGIYGVLLTSLLLSIFIYEIWEIIVFVTILFLSSALSKLNKIPIAPYLLPRGAPFEYDLNSPIPGTNRKKFSKPLGEVYLGVEAKTEARVFISFKDLLTHFLATGSTGSGKTETLLSLAYNCISAGGAGFMFSDAKADAKVIFKKSWMAKRALREDDVLNVSYLSPDSNNDIGYQSTNTTNPTQEGGAKEVANVLLSLLPTGDGGSNASFSDGAITLTKVLTSCLIEKRDRGALALNWGVFQEYLTLDKLVELTNDSDLTPTTRHNLDMFVYGIAGMERPNPDPTKQAGISSTAYQQFGYLRSYLVRGIDTLTNTFGYIFGVEYGDMSFVDVVHSGRILGTYIPALDNTSEELEMLGKIDMSGKLYAMSQGLQRRVEGTVQQVRRQDLYKGGVPTINIIDEFQAAAGKTPGVETAVTQGRSLGIATGVGVQSYKGLDVNEQADEFMENTKMKYIGRITGTTTYEEMNKLIGENWVAKSEGRTRENADYGGSFQKLTTSYEKEDRLSQKDLSNQIEGEFTIYVDSKLIRVNMFFVETPFDTQKWDFPEQASVIFNSFVDRVPIDENSISKDKYSDNTYAAMFSGEKRPEMDVSFDLKGYASGFLRNAGLRGAIAALYPNQEAVTGAMTAPPPKPSSRKVRETVTAPMATKAKPQPGVPSFERSSASSNHDSSEIAVQASLFDELSAPTVNENRMAGLRPSSPEEISASQEKARMVESYSHKSVEDALSRSIMGDKTKAVSSEERSRRGGDEEGRDEGPPVGTLDQQPLSVNALLDALELQQRSAGQLKTVTLESVNKTLTRSLHNASKNGQMDAFGAAAAAVTVVEREPDKRLELKARNQLRELAASFNLSNHELNENFIRRMTEAILAQMRYNDVHENVAQRNLYIIDQLKKALQHQKEDVES